MHCVGLLYFATGHAVVTAGDFCGPEGSQRWHDAKLFSSCPYFSFSFFARGKYNCEN
jgi:hypothetical protein